MTPKARVFYLGNPAGSQRPCSPARGLGVRVRECGRGARTVPLKHVLLPGCLRAAECAWNMPSPFLHVERADDFPAGSPSPHLHSWLWREDPPSLSRRTVKLRGRRVWALPRKREGSSSLATTLPPPALTLLVVTDTKALEAARQDATGRLGFRIPSLVLTSLLPLAMASSLARFFFFF